MADTDRNLVLEFLGKELFEIAESAYEWYIAAQYDEVTRLLGQKLDERTSLLVNNRREMLDKLTFEIYLKTILGKEINEVLSAKNAAKISKCINA